MSMHRFSQVAMHALCMHFSQVERIFLKEVVKSGYWIVTNLFAFVRKILVSIIYCLEIAMARLT